MTPMSPVNPPPARLREIDLLRFVAALLVMIHHYVGRLGGWGVQNHHNMPGIAQIAHFGNLGVDLFFLISGFVILMSAWGRGVGDFAVSRVVRIFPGYWFGVTLAVVAFLAIGQTPWAGHNPIAVYLPNMTMFQMGIGVNHMEVVYWTLWVELHFYVLISLLVWRGITYERCLAFMVLWIVLGTFSMEADFLPLAAILLPPWAPYFVAGMAFYLIHRFGPNLLLWLIVFGCWGLAVPYRIASVSPELEWPEVWDAVVTGGVTFAFLVMAMVSVGMFDIVRWRGFTVLGALTYPLYLVHETVGRVLDDLLGAHLGRWTLLGVSCAAALAAAYLVQRFVEAPAQRWARRRLKAALARLRREGLPAVRRQTPSRSPAEASR
ncbi:acyltransferase family protein [Actinomadura decatromicini]|uniref:Acyltransferase n=1 Tax=Actinomadura decatromicini TaxID=2604572 RepID=A0A5D3F6I9_9ACTN|nr:acyltransferase [Actinomadura decatromicini]TYK43742.1 acyltransferase [Actinomadura decatromicini]